MSLTAAQIERVPAWCWIAPLCALGLVFGLLFGGWAERAPVLLALAAALLLATVFAAVHHAEILALRLGEPLGSIVLALAVTIIEVALIVSLMLSGKAGAETLARDTVYATVMLVLTGIVGACLLLGGVRHHEQSFRLDGATSALSVLGTMTVLSLILPDFTRTTTGPTLSPVQLTVVGLVSVALYATFLYVQTTSHRDYFAPADDSPDTEDIRPTSRRSLISLALLVAALLAVVLLAKALSPALEGVVSGAGLPPAFVGVVIAAIVLLPESLAALRAAKANRLQVSLNLALGSALATIGLTIPIVGFVALYLGLPMELGLPPTEVALLLLALYISGISLATGRTTVLQGAVHLGICAVFLTLAAFP
ncbi:ionic transporter y4hA [beta proteobacterium AAP99]|nr:ionic transporter y4hA [beta proteobacterium AAP99]